MLTFDIGTAQVTAPNEEMCGDGVRVWRSDLASHIVIVDGLGHGPRAAEASEVCLNTLDACLQQDPMTPLATMLEVCHNAMRKTRGAAASIVRLQPDSVSFAGVGNVRLKPFIAGSFSPLCSAGVLGNRLPRIRTASYTPTHDDILVLFSDGIAPPSHLPAGSNTTLLAAHLAAQILQPGAVGHDDASVATQVVRAAPPSAARRVF